MGSGWTAPAGSAASSWRAASRRAQPAAAVRVSVVTDGDDAHGAHDVDGVGGDGTPWSMADRRAAARHARAIGRSLPQRLFVVAWMRDAQGVMVERHRPNASAPCATAARSASVTLASDGSARSDLELALVHPTESRCVY